VWVRNKNSARVLDETWRDLSHGATLNGRLGVEIKIIQIHYKIAIQRGRYPIISDNEKSTALVTM